jgi:hypothetical protein
MELDCAYNTQFPLYGFYLDIAEMTYSFYLDIAEMAKALKDKPRERQERTKIK